MKPESIQKEALMRWPIKMIIEDSPFGEIETDINISNREAFISGAKYASQFTASPVQSEREESAEFKALGRLVFLKHYKEKQGETEYYLREKPKAWEVAKQIIYRHRPDSDFKIVQSAATPAPVEQPENNPKTIDSYLRKMKVDGKTKITLALLIELLDGYANKFFEDNKGEQKGWIDVNDRLPENSECVFVCMRKGQSESRMMAMYQGAFGWKGFFIEGLSKIWQMDVTHWQPLPLSPQK